MARTDRSRGFVLVTTMMVLTVLLALLGAYFLTSNLELSATRFSGDSAKGFYAAEAGLNMRAETIRTIFVGYNRPAGSSPNPSGACEGSNQGLGDFRCIDFSIGNRTARTYVVEDPDNPRTIPIEDGDRYQGLTAQEYRYTARSVGLSNQGKVEALLDLEFKSRLVPLFQFAAFYNKDLEILPGPQMTLNGPVHTNGNLYLNSDSRNPGLAITGQVTVTGDLFRGRKNTNSCVTSSTSVFDRVSLRALAPSCSNRTLIPPTDVAAWNGMIHLDVPPVTVPDPELIDPTSGNIYWDRADLRVILRVDAANNPVTTFATTGIEVREQNNNVNTYATGILNSCVGSIRQFGGSTNALRAVGTSFTFRNIRESNRTIRMLDVDIRALFDCLHQNNFLVAAPLTGKRLDDSTEGGLVFFFSVEGPNGNGNVSPYGVRIRNGGVLAAQVTTPAPVPVIRGLTVVSNQAVFLQGDYNAGTPRRPAAILADSFNVLSNNWYNSTSRVFEDARSTQTLANRPATNTTQNVALLAGTDVTGGVEGTGGHQNPYNGGLENYPRFHEDWRSTVIYTYNGSFVSLGTPRRVSGVWGQGNIYSAPRRVWGYDTSFNDAANLPPITPRFVYLRQELFVRDFERDGDGS